MAKCVRCKAETELYFRGAPVCPACFDEVVPDESEELLPKVETTRENSN